MSDMHLYQTLGLAAAKRRKELKLTQAAVAAGIGLTRASLANIETGRQKVLLHQVYRLANVLKLDSILDLLPASFSADAEQEELRFNIGSVSAAEREQLGNLVRLAMANEPPKRRGKS